MFSGLYHGVSYMALKGLQVRSPMCIVPGAFRRIFCAFSPQLQPKAIALFLECRGRGLRMCKRVRLPLHPSQECSGSVLEQFRVERRAHNFITTCSLMSCSWPNTCAVACAARSVLMFSLVCWEKIVCCAQSFLQFCPFRFAAILEKPSLSEDRLSSHKRLRGAYSLQSFATSTSLLLTCSSCMGFTQRTLCFLALLRK